ncbi:MAG: acyltransferase family protein [Rhizobiaceae bacterium]
MLTPLTSLRFFAAVGVVLFHMANRWGMPPPKSMPFGVGVDLFFVLSGFILAYNYPIIHGLGSSLKLIGYRIARIWPLNIVTLIAAFVLLWNPADPFKDISKAWASVLLIQAWFGNHLYAFNGNSVGWSLSVELAFYIVFPFLIMLSSHMVAVVTAALTIATLLWADTYWVTVGFSDNVTSGTGIMMQHPGAFLVQFSAGILAARAFLRTDWRGLSSRSAMALELLAAALCVFYFFYNRRLVNASFLYLDLDAGPLFYLLRNAFGIVFFLPIIFVLAVGKGGLSAVLRNRVLVFAGEISFATYMCHAIIIGPMEKSGLDGTAAIIVYLAAVYAVSALLHFTIELPGQRWMRGGVDTIEARLVRIWSRCRKRQEV